MVVNKEKQEELQRRMDALGIKQEDLIEKFILGSGKGGQKINKTSSCVYLKHQPTGIQIKCQVDRSREMNRFFARRELCERIENQRVGIKTKEKALISKIRRQKQRRSRKSKEKMLADKKNVGDKKKLRFSPSNPD